MMKIGEQATRGKKRSGPREATAYHEAGHALMAIRVGMAIKYVTIVPDKETAGSTVYDRPILHGIHLDYDHTPRARIRGEDAILVCLAGPIAQKRYRPSSVRNWHALGDYRKAVDIAMSLNGSDKQVDAYLRWLEIRARDTVNVDWESIELVAKALLEKQTLKMADVRRVAFGGFGR